MQVMQGRFLPSSLRPGMPYCSPATGGRCVPCVRQPSSWACNLYPLHVRGVESHSRKPVPTSTFLDFSVPFVVERERASDDDTPNVRLAESVVVTEKVSLNSTVSWHEATTSLSCIEQ